MPGDDGLGLDDDESGAPAAPHPEKPHPEKTVRTREPDPPRARTVQDLELMPEREDLELQGHARAQGGPQNP